MTKPKPVMARLFEAYQNARGVRLTADDVSELVGPDHAIRVRITNEAAEAAGLIQCGGDELNTNEKTWKAFQRYLRKEAAEEFNR